LYIKFYNFGMIRNRFITGETEFAQTVVGGEKRKKKTRPVSGRIDGLNRSPLHNGGLKLGIFISSYASDSQFEGRV